MVNIGNGNRVLSNVWHYFTTTSNNNTPEDDFIGQQRLKCWNQHEAGSMLVSMGPPAALRPYPRGLEYSGQLYWREWINGTFKSGSWTPRCEFNRLVQQVVFHRLAHVSEGCLGLTYIWVLPKLTSTNKIKPIIYVNEGKTSHIKG